MPPSSVISKPSTFFRNTPKVCVIMLICLFIDTSRTNRTELKNFWTRLKNCTSKLSKQNLTVHQRYSTTLHIFFCVSRCERLVICMHARANWTPHTLGYKKMAIFSRMHCSKPDMYRQRLQLSPVGIHKRLYQKRAHSTGCRLMLNPFVCYTLNTDSVDLATSANSTTYSGLYRETCYAYLNAANRLNLAHT